MGSHGRTEECPICKNEMNVFDSDFLVECTSMTCNYCGFQGNMKYDMEGTIFPDISEDQAISYIEQFEELFNELSDEDKEKYINDIKNLK